MSNALAIAGVTAVIKDLLDNGMIDHKVTDAIGKGVTVSATAPDNIEITGPNATPRLNLFLHQVTPNAAWRNVGFPSHDSTGARVANPPLALDLHYLLTAYGTEDLQAEVLLGYAMQLLHEAPVLARESIRKALNPSPVNGNILPSVYQALRSADLAEQVEQIKITPTAINPEEMSRFWSALQAHYRPTVAYYASVVLIEPRIPSRSPLPVLSRGKVDPVTQREKGVAVQASLIPSVPTLESVELAGGQVVVRLGEAIKLNGHHLGGTNRAGLLTNDRFNINQQIPALAGSNESLIEFTLPNQLTDFPVGIYMLSAQVTLPGEPQPRTTNQLSLVVAPKITTALPMSVPRNADGTATIVLDCTPQVRPGQSASIILGDSEVNANPFTVPVTKLTFQLANPVVGLAQLARLRIDGIDSPIIDRSPMPDKPPVFFDYRITVT